MMTMLLGHFQGSRLEVLEGVTPFVLGVLHNAYEQYESAFKLPSVRPTCHHNKLYLPTSASLENLDVHLTKVESARSPEVTGQQRIVLTALEYDRLGSELMTE